MTVRRLGLGTMSLTGRGTWGDPPDPTAAPRLLQRAAALGVQLVDTANSYGPETAERLVREALHPYDGLLIATKGGFRRHGPHEWEPDCRPESLRAACEESLRRLGVERIDLYQLHLVDPCVPLAESMGVLVDLQGQGKIRQIGVCNVDEEQLARARATARVVSVQNRYSLVERGSRAVLERCGHDGLAFIAWAPVAKGFLSTASGAVFAIPGTSSLGHLEENPGALDVDLTDEEVAELENDSFLSYRARRLARGARVRAGRLKAVGRR